ncbi:tryptophan--tRNA ligase [Candidatus Peregrinibacteria bacterium]|nr:tryptophan--tRNA ligase [Candidatus Peregrinibacteria bacterium]
MRVLSGIQPSGQLHLGNYFGSIRPNLEYAQKAGSSFYFVADLHALTTIHDPEELRRLRLDTVLDYLACGFDPEKSVLYFQSDVPFHAELAWILSTVTPMGLLERAVSYKEKVEKGIAASVGLFAYPVLMAADILLYAADLVPVGKDQKQHLEMARDIAVKFNRAYGETLVVPEPLIRAEVAVVPGADGQKMSKSYGNIIPLFGSEEAVKKAVMGIVTDSKGVNDPKDPDTCVIFQIHKLFLDDGGRKTLAAEYRGGLAYGEAKKRLLQTVFDHFAPMRKRRDDLKKNMRYVEQIMSEGAKKAGIIALETMERVRQATGLR